MINKRQKTKKLVLALAVVLAWPVGATAQGMFQRGSADEDYYGGTEKQNSMLNRSDVQTNGVIDNQTFGQSPIGSGIVILLAAAAGYATLKRRKEDEQ